MNWRDVIQRTWEFLYPPYELIRFDSTGNSASEEPTGTVFHGKKAIAEDVQQSHIESPR